MSTTYGEVILRDGRSMEVEAFGVTGVVKLVLPAPAPEIALDEPQKVRDLIAFLEIAYDHCWYPSGESTTPPGLHPPESAFEKK